MRLDEFQTLARAGYNRIPVYREAIFDMETPLTCYLKLANQPFSYLFESVKGGETWGRYSVIGLPCRQFIQVRQHTVQHIVDQAVVLEQTTPDPLQWLETFQRQFKLAPVEQLPRFYGGFVGYFSYDTIRYVEPKLDLSTYSPDPIGTPEILLLLTEELIIFDRLANQLFFIMLTDPSQENAWQNAQQRIDELQQQMQQPLRCTPIVKKTDTREFQCSHTKAKFCQSVDKIKEYINAGDIMQTVYSLRFSAPYTESPIQLYRAIRHLNPSPYMYYLNLGDHYIVGSSPEILVRVEDNTVTVRPIAGTRKRGETAAEDLRLEQELQADEKELAEHLMLIDLGRNDASRVCESGSVKVTETMGIERYSHVMHMVSQVEGKLRADHSLFDTLRATFPAGTVSGAPKFRAMQIIQEQENIQRGIYGGAIGYLSWHGNLDLAIAIRTAIIKDQQVHIQAGAGIVYDSIPENEWDECCNKAQALRSALDFV